MPIKFRRGSVLATRHHRIYAVRRWLLIGSICTGLLLTMAVVLWSSGGLDRLLLLTARQLQSWAGVSAAPLASGGNTNPPSYEEQLRRRLGLDWTILAGRWRLDDGVITYVGPDGQTDHGLILSAERLWNGSLETVVQIADDPTAQAQIVFSHNPVTRAFYAAGVGDTHAYALQSFTRAAQLVQVFGQRQDIGVNTRYRLKLSLSGDRYSLSINNVKVMSGALPTPPFSDRVGLYVSGEGPVSFESFQVQVREPPAR